MSVEEIAVQLIDNNNAMPFRQLPNCELSSVGGLQANELAKNISCVVMGGEGVGKSCLIATAPAPVLFIDWDGRAASVLEFARHKNLQNIFTITLADKHAPAYPTAASTTSDVISRLENNDMKLSSIFPNVDPQLRVKSIACDSLASYSRFVFNQIYADSPILGRTISIGGNPVTFPASFDAWNAEMREVENFIIRVIALPCHKFFTLHEEREELPKSSREEVKMGIVKFTGRMTTYPGRFYHNLRYFNEVWRVVRDSMSGYAPKVHTKPDAEFVQKTALLLDAVEEPDIAAMLRKHNKRVNLI